MRRVITLVLVVFLAYKGYTQTKLCDSTSQNKHVHLEGIEYISSGKKRNLFLQDTCAYGNRFSASFFNEPLSEAKVFLPALIIDTALFQPVERFLKSELTFDHSVELVNGQRVMISSTSWKRYRKYVSLMIGVCERKSGDTFIVIQLIKPADLVKRKIYKREMFLIAGTPHLKFIILRKRDNAISFVSYFPSNLWK